MTDEELKAIKDRVDRATPGPWAWEAYGEKSNNYHIGVAYSKDETPCSGQVESEHYDEAQNIFIEDILWSTPIGQLETHVNYSDADFIAHAREDIPKLIAEVERLHIMEQGLLTLNEILDDDDE